jgi:hypothetical protein
MKKITPIDHVDENFFGHYAIVDVDYADIYVNNTISYHISDARETQLRGI